MNDAWQHILIFAKLWKRVSSGGQIDMKNIAFANATILKKNIVRTMLVENDFWARFFPGKNIFCFELVLSLRVWQSLLKVTQTA